MNKNVDLLNGNIRKALLKLSAPLAATAFIQMAYTLVDAAWIGRIGTNAVAATGTAGFIVWISQSIIMIPKIGMGVLSSQYYGRGDRKETRNILKTGMAIAVVFAIIFSLIVLLFRSQYIAFYGLEEEVNRYANDYLVVIAMGFVFTFLNPIFSQAYNSLGNSVIPFKINALGLIVNIILDPIMIFGIGDLGGLGIRGAAMATVFSNFIVSVIFIIDFVRKDELIKEAIEKGITENKWIKRIIKLGFPSALLNGFHALITIILSRFMAEFGARPIAVYSIGSQMESLSWMTTEGVQVAISSIIAQNYGANHIDRVRKAIREGIRLVAIIGIFAFFILFIFRMKLFKLFVPEDNNTIILGSKYLLILSFSQPFMAIEIGITGIFNGLSDTKTPAMVGNIMNALRIPISLLLMGTFAVLGVWMSMTITSVLKGILNAILLKNNINNSIVFNNKTPSL